MRFARFQLRFRWICVAILCALAPALSHAAGGQKIEISDPDSAIVGTNLSPFAARSDDLREFDSNFGRPAYAPKSSLNAVMAPAVPVYPVVPRVTRVPTQKEREALDLRKNWAFSTPEEFLKGTLGTAADEQKQKEYNPDGTEKQPLSVMERYFQHNSDSGRGTNQNLLGDYFNFDGSQKTNVLFGSIPDSQPLNGVSVDSIADQMAYKPDMLKPETVPDVFGFNKGLDPAAIEKQQREQQLIYEQHMKEFKKLWEFQQPTAVTAPASPLATASGNDTSPGFAPAKNFNSSMGAIPSSANPAVPRSSLTPVMATPPPARLAPPTPDFSVPQRRF